MGETLDRNSQHKVKAVIESANADYKSLVNENIINQGKSSNAILVNDDGEVDGIPKQDDLAEDSNDSELSENSKSPDSKHEIFTKIRSKFDKEPQENAEETKDDSQEVNLTVSLKNFEKNNEEDQMENIIHPISHIDIERIGSPNKPRQDDFGMPDHRNKLDDDDDEEIKSGSQSINNLEISKNENFVQENASSMVEYYEKINLEKGEDLSSDINLVVDDICKGLIGEIDKDLFPQRPLFFLTADLSSISLDQAITLLEEITPEKERMMVDKIIEKQSEIKNNSKKSNKLESESSKIVLYEKKGIRTDLVAVEHYVDALQKHLVKNKEK